MATTKRHTKSTAAAEKKTNAATLDKSTGSPKRSYVRKTVTVHIQHGGKDWDTQQLADRAATLWAKANGQKKTAAKQLQLYVKPEEHMVYYVVNDVPGAFSLLEDLADE